LTTAASASTASEQIAPLLQQLVNAYNKGTEKEGRHNARVASELDQVEAEAEDKWKHELLDALLSMSPTAFERLAQRLLRESGSQARSSPDGRATATSTALASTKYRC